MSCETLSQSYISDNKFLELMIKHHNIAIKMSQLIQMNSSDDYILNYARRVIYNQTMEVKLMEKLLKTMPNVQNVKSNRCGNDLLSTKLSKLYPGVFTNLKCDNSHFENIGSKPIQLNVEPIYELVEPEKQVEEFTENELNENHKMSNQEYIDHMVAHHNSGVELSKLVLKSTTEPKILALAQNIVLDQEKEMFEISYLYNCIKYNWGKTKCNN